MARIAVALLFLFAAATIKDANGAELKLMITNGAKPIVAEIASQFERNTSHKLSIAYEGSPILQEAILRGDNFDVALLISSNMDALVKGSRIEAATRVNIARSGLGVAVRAGQPKPDISTVDAFKLAMLNAKSIAYVTSGASGRHFIAACERLGIAEQVKAKGKTLPSGNVAEFVANGEAELAIQQMSEVLSVSGIDLVGPFPPDLDLISQITAAVSANSKQPEAAKAFIKFLATPEVTSVIRAKGMEPG
ncbi:molybdate transport system substrate-binding protein [Rhizobiales bacterium GAS188]|nr:molybdate transport system substrate-binding protein [Rhizobiales bacterium GAS188]